MSDVSDPRSVLKELEQRARKRFGQHFLARRDIVQRMVRVARIQPGDRVLEIGPGLGILTETLLEAGASVTAVEVDDDLFAHITERFPAARTVHADATRVDWASLCEGGGWKVVANLPYNVGTGLVMDLAARGDLFSQITVMLQAEVVARFVATPSTKAYGALTVQLAARGQARAVFAVPPTCFVPPPKVHSTVVHLEVYETPQVGDVDPRQFDRVVRAAFSQRRKTLRNSLGALFGRERAEEAILAAGLDPGTRAETIDLPGFRALAHALADAEQDMDGGAPSTPAWRE